MSRICLEPYSPHTFIAERKLILLNMSNAADVVLNSVQHPWYANVNGEKGNCCLVNAIQRQRKMRNNIGKKLSNP